MILVLVMLLLGGVVGGASPATATSISALATASPTTVTPISALAAALPATAAHSTSSATCYNNVTIKANANGKYVSAEKSYTGSSYGMLRARTDKVGSWELYE
jgi:type IV secretory pathway TrbL component